MHLTTPEAHPIDRAIHGEEAGTPAWEVCPTCPANPREMDFLLAHPSGPPVLLHERRWCKRKPRWNESRKSSRAHVGEISGWLSWEPARRSVSKHLPEPTFNLLHILVRHKFWPSDHTFLGPGSYVCLNHAFRERKENKNQQLVLENDVLLFFF